MNRYGIIGKPLGHSYSERYFTELFAREGIDAQYKPYPIDHIEEVKDLLKQLDGFNVTYPYKEAILPYLSEIDSVAQEIGAVNVVCHGKGYNTDWIGFRDSLAPLVHSGEKALLLGTGGVSKAIQYALTEMGVGWTLVSRRLGERREAKGERREVIGYEEVDELVMREHRIIVNCTPLGMHPYENELPNIPYAYLDKKHLLYDCIYNPERTLFLQKGEEMGCQVKNGLEMLHRQADEAWRVFSV